MAKLWESFCYKDIVPILVQFALMTQHKSGSYIHFKIKQNFLLDGYRLQNTTFLFTHQTVFVLEDFWVI